MNDRGYFCPLTKTTYHPRVVTGTPDGTVWALHEEDGCNEHHLIAKAQDVLRCATHGNRSDADCAVCDEAAWRWRRWQVRT